MERPSGMRNNLMQLQMTRRLAGKYALSHVTLLYFRVLLQVRSHVRWDQKSFLAVLLQTLEHSFCFCCVLIGVLLELGIIVKCLATQLARLVKMLGVLSCHVLVHFA
jgi:hypothetical protein